MNKHLPPELCVFLGAFLFFLIIRSKDITVVLKKSSQRTEGEEFRVKRGLRRSLFLEIFIFVPASALLMVLITPLLFSFDNKSYAWYSLVGIVSYGFPFAAIKKAITEMALATLKEYEEITPEYVKKEKLK